MVKLKVRKHSKPILNPDDFNGEFISIRNPGAIKYNGNFYLLVTIRHMKDRKMRIHLAKSQDGKNFKLDMKPFIDNDKNSVAGVEDVRITKIKEVYYLTFTAYNGHDREDHIITKVCLAKTKDFKKYFGRKLILTGFNKNKNGIIFWANGYYYVFHRPFGWGKYLRVPGVYLGRTKDFRKFEHFGKVFSPRPKMWDDAIVGANTPPIKIVDPKFGECYFMLYHGVSKKKNIYCIGYLLLDKDNPQKVLERSKKPLISPKFEWEKKGEIDNVIFGQGLIPLSKNKLRFYYGGADKYIGYADIILEDAELVEEYEEET